MEARVSTLRLDYRDAEWPALGRGMRHRFVGVVEIECGDFEMIQRYLA